jgi:hypothetical protein
MVVVLIALSAAGACGGSNRPSGAESSVGVVRNSSGESGARAGQPDAARLATGGSEGSNVVAGGAAVPNVLPAGIGASKIVKTASLDVSVKKGRFASAFSEVATIAAANGGFVASSTSASGREGESGDLRLAAGSLVVRVPADRFDETRRQLVGLGRLTSERLSGEDLSGQLADIAARLRNLRSQEEAIRLLMARATTIGETIEVQQQLSGVREQIEKLAGEEARLGDAVALSTITVALSEPGVVVKTEDERSPIVVGFEHAIDGAEGVIGATILTLGYLIPLVGLGLLLALALRPLLRSRRGPDAIAAR